MTEGYLEVVIEVPDDASDEEIERVTRELVDIADSIHREQGGHGLRVTQATIDGIKVKWPWVVDVRVEGS